MKRNFLILATAFFISAESHAIIIIPIPNLGFPPALGKIRDALEKSTDTKALATAGEDKTFGSRQWVWGSESGKMTQADADERALRKCEATLANMKAQRVGGQPLYDFGTNRCELYKFAHVTLNLPDPVVPPAPVAVQPSEPAPAPTPIEPPAAPATPAVSVTPSIPATSVAAEPAPVQSPVAQQTQPKANTDIVQKMKDLDTLYKQNLITKPEYERKKKQLLDAM